MQSYLTTGNRPLRVFQTMQRHRPVLAVSADRVTWHCVCRTHDDTDDVIGRGDAPATAILACAAAMEEGNE